MDVVVERCAGVDIGKDEVVACVRTPNANGKGRRKQTRTFRSFTSQLEVMADWFAAEGVTEVVMEATGSYWKPPWYVLEERGFDLKLVNARHVKIVPGRKTDVADAEWLAELVEHGLLRSSFVPPPAIRELRDLTRYRKRLIQEHTSECQRVQKHLEDAGIKLDSVASDVLGVSGRAMLRALIDGERDPEVLAELSKGVLRKRIPELREALRGRFRDHHAPQQLASHDHVGRAYWPGDQAGRARAARAAVPRASVELIGYSRAATSPRDGIDDGHFPERKHVPSARRPYSGGRGNGVRGAPPSQPFRLERAVLSVTLGAFVKSGSD